VTSILFLSPTATLGGAERCLLDLIASLRRASPLLRTGLLVGAEGPLEKEAERLGVEVRVLPLPERVARTGDHALTGAVAVARQSPALLAASAELPKYALALQRAVRAFGPQIVHSNGLKTHLVSALVPLGGAPVFWHMHDFVGRRAVMKHVLRGLAWRPAALIAVSRSVADDIGSALGRTDATVVYNGIDTTKFAPEGEEADLDALADLAPAPRGTLRVGLVATYARWKGQTLFLEAAARVVQALGPGAARFYIVGGSAYATGGSQFSREELVAEIARCGLEGVAGLVPFQSEPARAFRSLDVVVHASTQPEPFGRTIVEAMACAKPIIAAKEGGAAELVTHDVDSLAIAPRDPVALAGAIRDLLTDPARRARLGAEARRTATRAFARERIGPEVLAAYAGAEARAPDAWKRATRRSDGSKPKGAC
jgi:glycosyltransferase involved in cell wall biosynthesis